MTMISDYARVPQTREDGNDSAGHMSGGVLGGACGLLRMPVDARYSTDSDVSATVSAGTPAGFPSGPSGATTAGAGPVEEAAVRRRTVIMVAGAAGGVGTSTFAAIVARVLASWTEKQGSHAGFGQASLPAGRGPATGEVAAAAASGIAGTSDGPRAAENFVMPVDLAVTDPSRPGLDMILGLEEEPGPRWQDIQAPLGVVDGETLVARLPAADGVRVLAGRPWAGPPPRPWEQDAVWAALLGLPGTLVLDAGQGDPASGRLAPETVARAVGFAAAPLRGRMANQNHVPGGTTGGEGTGSTRLLVLLLVPPDFAALAATQGLVAAVRRDFPSAHLGAVVSRIGPLCHGRRTESGFSAGDIADILGVPVIGEYRRLPHLVRGIEAGVGLEEMPRRIVRGVRRILTRLASLPEGPAGGRHVR